ncbi:MAG TPA: hypothetical protein PKX10_08630 [Propioniciclava tarda]|nr:hypothetical protein [Propioniciclava tarda]
MQWTVGVISTLAVAGLLLGTAVLPRPTVERALLAVAAAALIAYAVWGLVRDAGTFYYSWASFLAPAASVALWVWRRRTAAPKPRRAIS